MATTGPRLLADVLRQEVQRMEREGFSYDPPAPGAEPRHRCETCGRELARVGEGFLAWYRGQGWVLECSAHSSADYDPSLGFLFANPDAAMSSLAQLAEKRWFDPKDFLELVKRIRLQRSGFYRVATRRAAAGQ